MCTYLPSELPLAVLQGHKARVVRVCFHPTGNYVVSASFDGTWRLWDVNTCTELLLQSGHSKEVFAVACQVDGSLVASGCVRLRYNASGRLRSE
jgi:U4/U6 small nuclear ribonucleoprotein PRP4